MRMPYHEQCMGQACSVLAYQTHLGWAVHGNSFHGLEKHPQPALHDKLRMRGPEWWRDCRSTVVALLASTPI